MFKNTKIYLFFLLSLYSLQGLAQNSEKKYQALLWEITHPENPNKKSYLYGTMHVSSRLAFNLGDTFFRALQASEVIALETEPTMWLDELSDYKWATSYFGSYPNRTYASPGFYQRIFPLNPPQNATIGSYLASSEEILNSLQYRNNAYERDFEEETYLDMFIFQAGKKTGKTVVGLENITHTNELLRIAQSERRSRKDDKPIPMWLEERMKKEDLMDIFENAYRVQDLDVLMEIQNLFSTEHYIHWFLNERNRLMADSMFVLMRNQTVFAGVGAAHLAGDKGMIEYLRRMGCSVRPISANRTEYAQNEKKRLEQIQIPLSLTLQTSPDKQFEIALPAKLYELPNDGKRFICSEMINGSYFLISKISTFDFFGSVGVEAYLAKIDSLLFENIPGVLLSKEKIKNGAFHGLEVKNKTKTGDLQHYQIFVTPIEILIFKMGGKGDFIQNWSDSVFSTLRFLPSTQNKNWSQQSFYYGGFAVDLPAYSVCDNNTPVSAIYNFPLFQGYDFATSSHFLLTRNYLADMIYVEEDAFELNRTAQKLAKKHNRDLENYRTIVFKGLPAADFVLKPQKREKGNPVFCRMIIDGPAYYLMLATTKNEKQAQQRFFNTFTTLPLYFKGFNETLNDTFLFFTTQTSVGINQSELRMRSKAEVPKPHENLRENYTYKSPTGERIRVFFEKFHQYQYYANPDSLFNQLKREILKNEDITYEVISEKRTVRKGIEQLEMLLSDTGSTRAIRVVCMLKKEGDASYILKMPVSRAQTTTSFLDSFLLHFTPYDSLLGTSAFKPKGKLFVDDLLSGDSLRFSKAMNGVSFVQFDSAEVPAILSVIKNYPFEEKNQLYLMEMLLTKLSETRHNDLVSFSKEWYLKYTANYPIQTASLQILCAQKSESALNVLEELIKTDLPYLMNQDKYVLSPIRHDSLRLWAKLYPLLFDYISNPDYKQIVYEDLIKLSDSQVITTEKYRSFLPQIIDESEYVLKVYLASEQKKQIEQAKNLAKMEKKNSYQGSYNLGLFQKYKLMLPFISDPEVKSVIARYEKLITNDWDRVMMLRQRLALGLPIDTSQINYLASQPHVLFHLYKQLSEIEKLNLIPLFYKREEKVVPLLLNVSQANNYTFNPSNSIDIENDTIKLLETKQMINKEGEYKVYVYEINQFITAVQAEKRNFDPKDFHYLAIVAVQMKEGKPDIMGRKYSERKKVENIERRSRYIEELLESFEVKNRPRASAEDEESFYSYW